MISKRKRVPILPLSQESPISFDFSETFQSTIYRWSIYKMISIFSVPVTRMFLSKYSQSEVFLFFNSKAGNI